jgi:4-amino-4-deoxy-L-arabinose transferase-like glycosyltransferase
VQLINGTIGALTVIVIYAIAADLFDRGTARWAALFMAFFPQMVFWSGAMYKDPAVMLCIALCMYSVLQLRSRFRVGHIALFVLSGLVLMTLRFYVFYFVGAATLGTFVFAQRRGFVGSLVTYGLLAGVFLGAFSFALESAQVERQRAFFDLKQIQIARSDQAMFGKSAFAAEQDVSTAEGAVRALPVGLIYLMFAPFPWAISGLRQALTLPETLVWYALMPAFFRGLIHTLRHRLRDALPILVFALSLTVAYSVFQGNVGTAYRQRTQITMFFFILMGVGLEQKRRSREAALPAAAASVARRPAWQR